MSNWDDFRFFLAVARRGTLSAAARDLSVNHATVLRRLRALEQTLETALFDRRPDGYGLTRRGKICWPMPSGSSRKRQRWSGVLPGGTSA